MSMVIAAVKEKLTTKCPLCDSEAIYRYGKAWTGKQRFICLICGRQFTDGAHRGVVRDKPTCPCCGESMNLYMRGAGVIRFRCSRYPECKTYKKLMLKEDL
jgi:transposase-like protein